MNIMQYIESFPWFVGALISVSTIVLLSILGLLIVRKSLSLNRFHAHHDVAGFVFANIGVLYAVLLGYIVVNAQQRFDFVKNTIEIEAGYITSLLRDAEALPKENKEEIRAAIKSYAQSVISDEWPKMAEGTTSTNTIACFQKIWTSYYNISLLNKNQEIWYAESVHNLNLLMQTRVQRLSEVQGSLGSEMWTLLIINGIMIISFIYLFGIENRTFHILMTGILAATTSFLLYLIYSLDSVFSGAVSLSPQAIQMAITSCT